MAQNWKQYSWQLSLASFLAITGIMSTSLIDLASAQNLITPDQTLGSESSRVDPLDSLNDLITGGAVRGANLFHSFLEFNVAEGRGAFFFSPNNSIQNIVTRVTGKNISHIQGVLGTINSNFGLPNANLFLINPNGIIFGPNAFISIGGSFFGSTASGIQFADGTLFSAKTTQTTPLLTVTAPIGLQFDHNIGNISVQGTYLLLDPGKTLALVGGNVTVDQAFIEVPGGQVAIGGISQPGTIGLNLETNRLPLSFPDNAKLADVTFKNLSVVDVRDEGGGQIQLQGRQITLSEGSILTAITTGSQNGKGIVIQGENLTLKDGSQVTASTQGTGDGGNLTVKASNSVQILGADVDGAPSGLFTETAGQGTAGKLTITTNNLTVEGGGNISATTRSSLGGRGGNLTVTASDSVKLSGTNNVNGRPSGLFAQTLGTGHAGSLTINTRQLIVQNGAQVTTGTGENSRGNGGTLTVRATDSIYLSGAGTNAQTPTGLFARSRGTGNAGSLNIVTRQLTVGDDARVTVESLGSGNGGGLDIEARFVTLDNQGKITAETRSGQGGNISLRNLDLLLLQGNSQITTNADTAKVGVDVAGGNINIDSQLIVATPGANSDITANAFRGRGGNIDITTNGLFGIEPRDRLTPDNDITATSQLGINGTIQINTPDVEPSKGIGTLPAEVFDASQAIAQICAISEVYKRGEMVITGRGGLPPSPDQLLSNDVVWSDTRLNTITSQLPNSHSRSTQLTRPPYAANIVPATSWVFNQQGEVTLIASAPNMTPYSLRGNSSACDENNTGI